MRFIKNLSNFIGAVIPLLENKDQALSILKKMGLDIQNVEYLEIKNEVDKVFKNNLNYLGLMTKYRFEQEISVQEIKDLMPWLKDNGNRLSKNPLTYKKFEDMKDEIIKIDNTQRVKTIYNLLPKRQKDLVKGDKEFYEKALTIHKLGFIKEFGRKLSNKKTKEDILKYMSMFIESNSNKITYDKTITSLRELNSKIIHEDPDEGIILAQIIDFETSNKVGSPDWCIVSHRGNWNSYVSGTKMQFFMWDFSLERTDAQFMVGFTTNDRGQITNIHDKYDASLTKEIPDKISTLLVKMDFSLDPFKYRKDIIGIVANDDFHVQQIDDDSNPNIIVLDIDGDYYGYNRLKSDKHPTLSFSGIRKYNIYIVYNFDHELSSDQFSYLVISNKKDVTLLEVHDNSNGIGKVEIEENGNHNALTKDDYAGIFEDEKITNQIMDWYKKGYFIPKDIREVLEEEKKEYLNKIEPYVKGTKEISSAYKTKKSKYINTSNDPGSTGKYWLFKIENGEQSGFKTGDSGYYLGNNTDDIQKNNYYVLIDIEEDFDSENFVRFISCSEEEIKIKEESIKQFPDDINNLVEKGFIIIKTSKEYSNEVSAARSEIFNKSEEDYSDTNVETYGKALFEYLCEEDEIDKSDYMEYDDDDNEIGVPSNAFKQVIIPDGGHYDLLSFDIFSSRMMTNGRGYGDSTWAIGTDSDADKSINDSYESLMDDIGPTGFNEWFWKNHLDTDRLVDYMLEGEDDYYRTEITDNPEYYSLDKSMKEGVESKIDESNEEINSIDEKTEKYNSRKDKVEERLEEYTEYMESKLGRVQKMIIDLGDLSSRDPRYIRLLKIEDKIQDRLDRNTERYEELRDNYDSEISDMSDKQVELEDLIGEMEDEDNEEYWEIDENEIEREVEKQLDNKKSDIEYDPLAYCESMGYDSKFLADFVDIDAMIEDAISQDGRGQLSGYDNDEREFSYNDVYYYIYRTN